MWESGIQERSKRRSKRATHSKYGGPIAPNSLARALCVAEFNRAWVTDVTAIDTAEGWLYLAPMLDLHPGSSSAATLPARGALSWS